MFPSIFDDEDEKQSFFDDDDERTIAQPLPTRVVDMPEKPPPVNARLIHRFAVQLASALNKKIDDILDTSPDDLDETKWLTAFHTHGYFIFYTWRIINAPTFALLLRNTTNLSPFIQLIALFYQTAVHDKNVRYAGTSNTLRLRESSKQQLITQLHNLKSLPLDLTDDDEWTPTGRGTVTTDNPIDQFLYQACLVVPSEGKTRTDAVRHQVNAKLQTMGVKVFAVPHLTSTAYWCELVSLAYFEQLDVTNGVTTRKKYQQDFAKARTDALYVYFTDVSPWAGKRKKN